MGFAMMFATSPKQFAQSKTRKVIFIGTCDGSSKFNTLEHQLIAEGILDTKWSMNNDDEPGSIFYWFKHVGATEYIPESYLHHTDAWHCGICYHEINHIYRYSRMNGGPVNLTEDIDVMLPETIISGSECINLTEELRALTNYIDRNGFATRGIFYKFGRIAAREIIASWDSWKKNEIALPVQWFYFEPVERQKLMLGQDNSGYGRHVEFYGRYDSVPRCMAAALRQPRNIRAYQLFNGLDEYKKTADLNTVGQVATSCHYVVLTRDSAKKLAGELNYRYN